ncbi:MAG TPA: pilus assembly protein PilM, partial [Candidatus Eremiobacteraeota bacterium]|nr:pilus assembly protein PilM [Candidatus Eremiobacteraeota bacterium]
GTMGYASPEQFRGKAQMASDIYSLGVTLYVLLTGYDPKKISEQFTFPQLISIRNDISPELSFVIGKAIEFKICNRYSTALQMKEALLEVKNIKPPVTHPERKSTASYEISIDSTDGLQPVNMMGYYVEAKEKDFLISCNTVESEIEHIKELSDDDKFIKEKLIYSRILKIPVAIEDTSTEFDDNTLLCEIKMDPDLNEDLLVENLCVDVENSFVKLLQMDIDSNNYLYPRILAIEKTPHEMFKKENVINANSLIKLIKDCIKENNLSINKLSFTIPSSQSLIKTFILPYMDDKKIPAAIKKELSTALPFPYSKSKVDMYIICPSIPGEEGFMKILVIAMNKDFINTFKLVGGTLGIKSKNIIPIHTAIFRVLQLTGEELNKIALIDLSSLNTGITIIKDGMISQTTILETGITNFLKAISIARKVSMNKAAEILENSKIDITRADKKETHLFHIIVPQIREWITELTKAFANLGSDYKLNKQNYSTLILHGEGGTIKSLNKFLGNQLGIKCYNFKMPVSEIENKYNNLLNEKAPLFMPSLGLSIDEFYSREEFLGEKIDIKADLWSSLLGS